ncbi:MAG: sugar nucleotide-binding protein [Planctomycetia bacterium]|nr:sugar nucleotide-binding protein [Planctomycetia bacterium]
MILHPHPAPPLPLLITGIAGVAGYNALAWFQQQFPGQVIGIRQRDNWRLSGPGIEACDAEDPVQLARLFDEHRFQSVLDCAGNCALRACELDRALAWRTNVEGVRNLLTVLDGRTMLDGRDVRLLHLSIDLVYSGDRDGNYIERDPPDPVTEYGATMVAAERMIQVAAPAACILRISLPMGISFNGHAGAIDWIQSRFRKSRPATLYFDEVRTPTYTDCLNELHATVLSSDLRGLYHASAPRQLSLFEIAQVINRVGGYEPELLRGCPRIEAGPIPPRAGNVSMNGEKLSAALGYQPFDPWPNDERFVPTDRQWHFRRETGDPGSPELLAEVLYRNPARGRTKV